MKAGEEVTTEYDRIISGIDKRRLQLDGKEADFVMRVEDYLILRRELAQLRPHIGEHQTLERIIAAHSWIPGDWPIPKAYPGAPHQTLPPSAYKQGQGEACYICTLLHLLNATKAVLVGTPNAPADRPASAGPGPADG